jgi:hypothetical protein
VISKKQLKSFFDEPAGNISASLPVFKGRRCKVHMPFQCPPWFPPRSNRPAGVSGDLALGRLKCTSVMEIDR